MNLKRAALIIGILTGALTLASQVVTPVISAYRTWEQMQLKVSQLEDRTKTTDENIDRVWRAMGRVYDKVK